MNRGDTLAKSKHRCSALQSLFQNKSYFHWRCIYRSCDNKEDARRVLESTLLVLRI
jgi:hypothetical protein